jgi:hypothetical protein
MQQRAEQHAQQAHPGAQLWQHRCDAAVLSSSPGAVPGCGVWVPARVVALHTDSSEHEVRCGPGWLAGWLDWPGWSGGSSGGAGMHLRTRVVLLRKRAGLRAERGSCWPRTPTHNSVWRVCCCNTPATHHHTGLQVEFLQGSCLAGSRDRLLIGACAVHFGSEPPTPVPAAAAAAEAAPAAAPSTTSCAGDTAMADASPPAAADSTPGAAACVAPVCQGAPACDTPTRTTPDEPPQRDIEMAYEAAAAGSKRPAEPAVPDAPTGDGERCTTTPEPPASDAAAVVEAAAAVAAAKPGAEPAAASAPPVAMVPGAAVSAPPAAPAAPPPAAATAAGAASWSMLPPLQHGRKAPGGGRGGKRGGQQAGRRSKGSSPLPDVGSEGVGDEHRRAAAIAAGVKGFAAECDDDKTSRFRCVRGMCGAACVVDDPPRCT